MTGRLETQFAKNDAAVDTLVTSIAEPALLNVSPVLRGISSSISGCSFATTSYVSKKTNMSSAPMPIMTNKDKKFKMLM